MSSLPPHHVPEGGFRNPWPTPEREGGFVRWQWERLTGTLPPNPPPGALPTVASDLARPRAAAGEVRLTWVGHATFLLQIGGVNLLTDPHWSLRASPVQWAGPERFQPPGIAWEQLPEIDGVLLSHDHYDHLDTGTVRRVRERWGDWVRWWVPLGYRAWFGEQSVRNVTELDWWEAGEMDGPAGPLRIVCLPAQHWTRRTPCDTRQRLWSAWAVDAPGGRRVFFGGDSGWFPGYGEIGHRTGPIGAYAPRWFMRPAHMNPEEAVRAFRKLGGRGTLVGMHWGTWRLTDEDPLEPPRRLRAAWGEAGFPPERLWIPRHGETRVIPPTTPPA